MDEDLISSLAVSIPLTAGFFAVGGTSVLIENRFLRRKQK